MNGPLFTTHVRMSCARAHVNQGVAISTFPGTQKNLDPEHPFARDSRVCLVLPSFYILV
jgi:hypothetical protein